MAINKVVYGGKTLIDLTADTVTAERILAGYTAHGADGNVIEGSCDYDVNSQDATASASEVLSGKTAYVRGTKVTGTMVNNGAASGVISEVDETFTIPIGYHDGSGKVGIDDTEKAKIIAGNIKSGVNILGVEGTYAGEAVSAQAKTITPSIEHQTVLPDAEFDYLSQVTVNAIPYVETSNAAGGTTVTIAG